MVLTDHSNWEARVGSFDPVKICENGFFINQPLIFYVKTKICARYCSFEILSKPLVPIPHWTKYDVHKMWVTSLQPGEERVARWGIRPPYSRLAMSWPPAEPCSRLTPGRNCCCSPRSIDKNHMMSQLKSPCQLYSEMLANESQTVPYAWCRYWASRV